MIEQHDPLKRDPDIDRFVEITRQKLLEEVFFIDETEALSAFESARQISFIIPDSAFEATAKITIKALSFIPGKNVQEVYGRDCEITQYTADNNVKYKYHIPFVKFIPIIHKDGRHMLRMLFQAVDKQNDKIILRPIVIEGKMPVERQVSKLLPFSYDDFELIIAANTGEKSMTLPQLYTFRQTGPQYGFPAQIYHRELLARIGNVFLILIISIYMLVLAWRFRTPPYRQFKNSWALWFPVFFIIVTGFVETIRYCTRLMIVLFTDTFYTFSSALLLLVYILFFIGVSFLFIAQRSDG